MAHDTGDKGHGKGKPSFPCLHPSMTSGRLSFEPCLVWQASSQVDINDTFLCKRSYILLCCQQQKTGKSPGALG